jgi:hypothetical protein
MSRPWSVSLLITNRVCHEITLTEIALRQDRFKFQGATALHATAVGISRCAMSRG